MCTIAAPACAAPIAEFAISSGVTGIAGCLPTVSALPQLEPLCQALGGRATLRLFADADHSFHVPARTGRTDSQVRAEMLYALAAWIDRVLAGS